MTIRSPIIALLLALVTATGHAEGLSGSRFTVGAFGTLGALYQNARGLAYRRSISQGHGARAGEVDFGTDSLLGLQLAGRVTDDFDAQVQTVLRRNAAGVWRPELARAFLRYRPNPAVMVRAGRIGLGVYLLANTVDVGYSYLTIRPPAEVYGLLASEHFDGADVALSRQIGGGVGRIRVLGGHLPYQTAMPDGSVITFPNMKVVGMTADFLYRAWQTRAALLAIHVPERADPVATALARTGFPQAMELADELNRSPQNTYAVEIGALYEGDPLQGALVLVHINSDYLQGPKSNSGFAQLGYRIAQLTPYLALSMTENFATARRTGLPSLPVFEPLIAAAQEDQTALQTTQRDLSLGVRYDFAPHMDIKAQIDRIWLHQSALIFDYNVPPPGHTALTVFGLALDFAF
ncbi:MAG TPA: hypothetical protein VFN79_04845 [Steroidobacteraceae bacterium]|nr:hypothetical protein [Steroidobacteraceae bacterium]